MWYSIVCSNDKLFQDLCNTFESKKYTPDFKENLRFITSSRLRHKENFRFYFNKSTKEFSWGGIEEDFESDKKINEITCRRILHIPVNLSFLLKKEKRFYT